MCVVPCGSLVEAHHYPCGTLGLVFLLLISETECHISRAGLELHMQPRKTLNLRSINSLSIRRL